MITQQIKIRKYKPEDVQDLANIFYNTTHRINIQDYTQEQVDVLAPEECLNAEKWIEKFERTNPFVAVVNEQVVGFAELIPDGYIDCFYCHHDWIGRGVGSALMKTIYQEAIEEGIKGLYVDVNIKGKPFFEKYGFIIVEEVVVNKKNVPFKICKMKKILN